MRKAPLLLVLALLGSATAASAQANSDGLPWYAIDLHAATVGLPQAEGWVPVVSADTPLPGRGWGLSGGATFYPPFRLGFVMFGFGAAITTGKGSSASTTIATTANGVTTTRVTPAVHTGITSIIPQVSFNFGRRLGWSYISGGVGRSKVSSRADATPDEPEQVVPEAWNPTINFGGGARWFMKPHLGAGFDVRWVKLGLRGQTDTLPAAKRTQNWTISAGISIQ